MNIDLSIILLFLSFIMWIKLMSLYFKIKRIRSLISDRITTFERQLHNKNLDTIELDEIAIKSRVYIEIVDILEN